MNLFNLIAKITLDNKEFQKGIKDSESSGKTFGQKIAGGAKVAGKALVAMGSAVMVAGAALAKLTLGSIKTTDEIGKRKPKAEYVDRRVPEMGARHEDERDGYIRSDHGNENVHVRFGRSCHGTGRTDFINEPARNELFRF